MTESISARANIIERCYFCRFI